MWHRFSSDLVLYAASYWPMTSRISNDSLASPNGSTADHAEARLCPLAGKSCLGGIFDVLRGTQYAGLTEVDDVRPSARTGVSFCPAAQL
jgi:hypothetical protein